jgi:hypothetical protein
MTSTISPALPRDTSVNALRVQLETLRRMGETGRANLTADLSESLRQHVEAGVRHRHPEYDDRTVRLAAIRLRIGDDLFRRAFPHVRVEP